ADSEAQQKLQAEAEYHEIREQAADDKQAGARRDEWNGPAPLMFVESWRDEGPDRVKNPRRSDEQGDDERKFHPDDLEHVHRRNLAKLGRDNVEVLQRHRRGASYDVPHLVAENEGEAKGPQHAVNDHQEAIAKLLEVAEKAHSRHPLFFVLVGLGEVRRRASKDIGQAAE